MKGPVKDVVRILAAQAAGDCAWREGATGTALRCWIAAARLQKAAGASTTPAHLRLPEATR